MRLSILICLLVGCAVDPGDPKAPPMDPPATTVVPSIHVEVDQTTGAPMIYETPRDVCALAAELPSGDICAMMCNPDAMKAQLIAEGSSSGACYEFSCGLPDATHVIVGVCLPP